MAIARPRRQAGGIVFRWEGDAPSVLIVSAARNPKRWVLPKGSVRRFERPAYAALREVEEEAGVIGRIVAPARVVEHAAGNGRVRLEYFLIEHIRDVKPKEKRRVQWCPVEDAIQLLSYGSARKSLLDANPQIVRYARKRQPREG